MFVAVLTLVGIGLPITWRQWGLVRLDLVVMIPLFALAFSTLLLIYITEVNAPGESRMAGSPLWRIMQNEDYNVTVIASWCEKLGMVAGNLNDGIEINDLKFLQRRKNIIN